MCLRWSSFEGFIGTVMGLYWSSLYLSTSESNHVRRFLLAFHLFPLHAKNVQNILVTYQNFGL